VHIFYLEIDAYVKQKHILNGKLFKFLGILPQVDFDVFSYILQLVCRMFSRISTVCNGIIYHL